MVRTGMIRCGSRVRLYSTTTSPLPAAAATNNATTSSSRYSLRARETPDQSHWTSGSVHLISKDKEYVVTYNAVPRSDEMHCVGTYDNDSHARKIKTEKKIELDI